MKEKLSNKTILIICVAVVCAFVLGIVISSVNSGDTSGNNASSVYRDEAGNTTSTNSSATLGDFPSKEPNTETTTKVSMTEWGFDNSDEWGNKLVEVTVDSNNNNIFKNEKGKFVIIKEKARFWEFYPEKEQVVFSWYYPDKIVTDDAGSCTNIDNNTLSLKLYSEDGGVLSIVDRKVVDTCVIFKIHDHSDRYYIPYSLLDLNKEPELYQQNSYYKYYKVYVK